VRVIDAGVVIDFLLGGLDPRVVRGEGAAVPHLLDSEVTHVLRRLVHRGDLSKDEGW
jgi:predicted nucleic acid-binding protein